MRRILAVLAFLAAVSAFSGGVWWFGYRAALIQTAERGRIDLRLAADRLVGQLARFRQIAVLLADHPALVRPPVTDAEIDNVSALLLRVADQSGARAVSLIGRDARVIASSSNTTSGNPTARGADFQRALSGAIGFAHTRNADGAVRVYTFMAPVFDGIEVRAVVSVQLDMETVEESDWRSAPEVIFFTDDQDSVFVTNRSELLFRTLRDVPAEGEFGPRSTRHVADQTLWSLDLARYLPRTAIYQDLPLPVIGLTGHVLNSTEPAARIAFLQTAVAAALCLAFGAFLFLATERRRTLALANQGLEARVAERTEELSRANESLRREIAERLEAEAALRKAQDDLVQAGKLSALGQMSAGISHELNQPLMAIRSFSENAVLLLNKDRPAEARENLSRISELARRMGRIIKNLRAFARQEHEPMTRVDIVAVIDAVLELSDARIRREGVVINWTRPNAPVQVMGGEVRLQQVIMNLASNALDAMSGQEDKRIDIGLAQENGKVIVSLRDTGPGLDDPDKIFDPFYTTKEVGQSEGMGLGLSISYGLVQSFGGAIRGRNHPQKGAVFMVELAAIEKEIAA